MTYALCVILAVTTNAIAQERRTVKVPQEIVRQLGKERDIKEFLEDRQEYTNDGLAKYLTAEQVDLNRDGKSELIVHGINEICGANNCYTWIYRKVGNSYQMLLYAGFIQQIEPQKTFTQGYRDVIGSMHSSASDSGLTLYNSCYAARGCGLSLTSSP